LLLPRVQPLVRRRFAVDPVAALNGLAAVFSTRDAFGVDHLTLYVESADEEVVAGVLQILKIDRVS
jgi:hypothetical protein